MNLSEMKHSEARYRAFSRDVEFKYQLFNGLFLALPFHDVDESGAILSIFSNMCNIELKNGKTAQEIVENFLNTINIPEERKHKLLFKFLQFIERQVVLFDALEDAAFSEINDLSGAGSINYLLHQLVVDESDKADLLEQILTYY